MKIKFISATSSRQPSLLRKTVVIIVMLVLATVALMFSVILLTAILIIAILGGVYLWWKTRAIRQQLKAQMQHYASLQNATARSDTFAGEIVEGEVVRVDESCRVDKLKTQRWQDR